MLIKHMTLVELNFRNSDDSIHREFMFLILKKKKKKKKKKKIKKEA